MGFIRKACKIGANILFWITITGFVLVTAVMIYARIGGNGQMMMGGFGFGHVVTGSMDIQNPDPENPLPSIPVGSFIVIQRVDTSSLKAGDVITFYSDDPTVPPGVPVSHMILRIESDENGITHFITKGTANPQEDAYPVYADDIVGKVIFTSTIIGSVVELSQSTYIYPILILLLVVSMIQSIIDFVKQLLSLKSNESSDSN